MKRSEILRDQFVKYINDNGGPSAVGKSCGLSRQVLSSWVRGETIPSLEAACAMLELMGRMDFASAAPRSAGRVRPERRRQRPNTRGRVRPGTAG